MQLKNQIEEEYLRLTLKSRLSMYLRIYKEAGDEESQMILICEKFDRDKFA